MEADIASNSNALVAELKRRKKKYLEKNVHPKLLAKYEAEGWENFQELKASIKVRKPWPHEVLFENHVWQIFYGLGYKEMNRGCQFQIPLECEEGDLNKQIDVFAKDDETVVIAECKSSEAIRKRRLQKDIEEFANLKGPLSASIKKFYGKNFKPKIVWIFATNNIDWSENDLKRAADQKITVLRERELRYLKQISEHIGVGAKYQFLAEVFDGQKIPSLSNRTIPATRGKLGGKTFYSFVIPAKDLLKISFINHRALKDPDGAPTYQRLIQKNRLRGVSNFIKGGGFFPNNILVNLPQRPRFDIIKKDELSGIHFGHLHLPNKYKSAWVIDGQHRLYGFSKLSEEEQNTNLFVLAFEGMSHSDEAKLFVTINSTQKKVAPSLLDDLDGELKWESNKPNERISSVAARIIAELNEHLGGPIYERVVEQDIKGSERVCLTVTGLKQGIRASNLIGRPSKDKKQLVPSCFTADTNGETLERALEALTHLFALVREANPTAWDQGNNGKICTNTGLSGWMQLMMALISWRDSRDNIEFHHIPARDIVGHITPLIEPALKVLRENDTNSLAKIFVVRFGSGGPKRYFFRLAHFVNQQHSDFMPSGYQDWLSEENDAIRKEAEQQLTWICAVTIKYVFDYFRKKYGEENDAYFEYGVRNPDWRSKAFRTSQDVPLKERLPLEHYLDWVTMRRIIDYKDHWNELSKVFHIPLEKDRANSKALDWVERVNVLRRVPAHKTIGKDFTESDIEYSNRIYQALHQNLNEQALGGDDIAKACLEAKV